VTGGSREVEGAEEVAGDPWASREFHIKWRRWSYIHTSWDTLATLSQLAGYKRVTNYIKRTNEAEARPPAAGPRRVPPHHARPPCRGTACTITMLACMTISEDFHWLTSHSLHELTLLLVTS